MVDMEDKYFRNVSNLNYIMTTDDVRYFIRASDSLYLSSINNTKKSITYFTDNQNIPPSSIFSSNIYYSKKSGKVITLLYSNSIATQGEYNHYMYGGGKYLFIPENKELVSEKIKTNKIIGWGFVLLTTLKLFIL